MNTLLLFAPLIIVGIAIAFGSILIIDDARRGWKEPPKHKRKHRH